LPDLAFFASSIVAILILGRWKSKIRDQRVRLITKWALLLCSMLVTLAAVAAPLRLFRILPYPVVIWIIAIGLLVAALALYCVTVMMVGRTIRRFAPERRQLLRVAGTAALAAPVALGSLAFLRREDLALREIDVRIPGLPKDLQGLRIVQLSDIHLSPFLHESTLARAIEMANETRPHIAAVTGDLISMASDPLDKCLQYLSQLRSDAGTFGCHGNHEIYAECEGYATLAGSRRGMSFLRDETRVLHFGDALLNIVGVDYQRRSKEYLTGAGPLVRKDATNLLLCHNPDTFPVAARQGYQLMLAGHTHGGQVNVEILEQHLNVARFMTPYVYGLYRRGASAAYVTRGIGTVGAPVRLGAPPEIALIRLCAT
jgi:predicted MPP superfamily phosphohydrolase